ncbi:MAG: YchF/TatD family DNA exonuclease, partial [Myxococcales bacterium]|nr:YchF/TatD family DNA exonuclease [Myxococcales bacterium]
MERIVTIPLGPTIADGQGSLDLCDEDPIFRTAVGLHPHDAKTFDFETDPDRIRHMAGHPAVVALGEMGLDYHYDHSPRDAQRRVFARQIELARELGLPIIVHDRESSDDSLRILREVGEGQVRGVVHCFSGTMEFAKELLGLGFLLSFTGIVTFKAADALREVVRAVPIERMMVETDAPYLAPIPHRGKRNEPSYVVGVAEKIAEIKGLTVADVARITTLNAETFFGLRTEPPEAEIAYRIRNSLYLNLTNRCTLACTFCPKFTDFMVKGHYLRLRGNPSFDEVVEAMGDFSDVSEVVFCGFGEPTQRLDLVKEVARYVHDHGKRVRLNTDGLGRLVHGRDILPELAGLIDAVSVSLNAQSAEVYDRICPSKYRGGDAYE